MDESRSDEGGAATQALGYSSYKTLSAQKLIHIDDQGLLQDCASLEEPVESRLRLGLDLVHEYKLLEYDM